MEAGRLVLCEARGRYDVHAKLVYGFCPRQGRNFTYNQAVSNCTLTFGPEIPSDILHHATISFHTSSSCCESCRWTDCNMS